jgi:hypothetical protein
MNRWIAKETANAPEREMGERNMKTWTVRLGLSLMVVVGLWTNRTPAQEYYVAPPVQVFVVPTIPYEPDRIPYYPPPLYPRPQPPAKHAVIRVLNHVGMACQADNFGAVGNFASEYRWMWGSSRNFFGEVCIPCTQRRYEP